jgi:glycerol-3-phosphate acyltransferase PlsX
MGGDHAPDEIVAGALLAAGRVRRTASLTLVWRRGARPRTFLTGPGADRIAVVHAPDAVPMDQHASASAAQRRKSSSLGVAVNAVKAGRSRRGRLGGQQRRVSGDRADQAAHDRGRIARPAIASVWPEDQWAAGSSCWTPAPTSIAVPEWLEEFGIMGCAYASRPCWASLAPESRPALGWRGAHQRQFSSCSRQPSCSSVAPLNFIGNIEGKDMFHNAADVVVADGFVGNVVLKSAEGMVAASGRP